MSYIMWAPELLDNPAFCALMAESPEYLGLWFRCLQIAEAAKLEGDLVVFGGRPLNPKALAQAHFRRADPETLGLAGGFLELALELGLLEQHGDTLAVTWWADFSKGVSETREAWRVRKAEQRARKKAAPPNPEPTLHRPEKTCPETVPGQSHDVTTQPNQPAQPASSTSSSKSSSSCARARANGKPAKPPAPPAPGSPEEVLERLRAHNEGRAPP